jgi:mannose-6-phosphate isomerase-like protein (cupin superfamily)
MRYVGTGGTGVAKDSNTVAPGHFTFSTMLIPAGNIGPSHIHYDVEEIFFVMRGQMKVVCEKDGQRWEAILGERDLISVPPGVYREEINIGDEDALMCVMLGTPKPITPVYPPDSPLTQIKRNLRLGAHGFSPGGAGRPCAGAAARHRFCLGQLGGAAGRALGHAHCAGLGRARLWPE